ncbi:hypothetical protein DEDE109153_04915 [Deinococcus deserti]|uniref:Uncharacterized protein n=1 Tax=Deinococcus deserti (strain DSM 17065 / CIP 109153 / LMG 22923 / VCD115) TaxID=546414 RepID=C1D157_DEIDV|nr:hypothetical protein [Deinococcus deserti]ACO45581.1 hypothetical protein Deide_07230 [Deinococcus deserti VCD115]
MICVSELIEKRDELLAGLEHSNSVQRRRLSEVRAREHVGAAGWAQSSTLEEIIRTGREGLSATDALRQVVSLTTEQLRTLPLSAPLDQRDGHLQALQDIVDRSEEQITAAQALDELLRQALDDVTHTPVQELNVQRLKRVHQRVREQVQALNTIIEAAQVQADTLEQLGALERVSAEHQQRVQSLKQFSAEDEVLALGEVGEQLVTRITQLDETPPGQLNALTRIGEAVVDSVPETGGDPCTQADALDRLARAAQDKSENLRGAQSDRQS